MKNMTYLILIMIVLAAAGCTMKKPSKVLTQIEYTISSGSILPELQADETFLITPAGVTFTRTGRTTDTEVEQGTWEYYVEPEIINQLFQDLQPFDCSQAVRIEPEDPPDGGFSETYTFHYSDGSSCTLYYDPGVTYTNADQAVRNVLGFVGPLMMQELF
jgi:hypothetical protein